MSACQADLDKLFPGYGCSKACKDGSYGITVGDIPYGESCEVTNDLCEEPNSCQPTSLGSTEGKCL